MSSINQLILNIMKTLKISAKSSVLNMASGPNFTQQMRCTWYFSAATK